MSSKRDYNLPILPHFANHAIGLVLTPLSTSSPPPAVLSFALSDPSAGSGVQGDVLAIAGQGCYPLTVTCGVGVCDTYGVNEFCVIDEYLIEAQARALLEDIPVGAVKVGQPGSIGAAQAIVSVLLDYPQLPIVLAPGAWPLAMGDDERCAIIELLARALLPLAQVLVVAHDELRAWTAWLRADGADPCGEGAAVLVLGVDDANGQRSDRLHTATQTLFMVSSCRDAQCWRGRHAAMGALLATGFARGLALPESFAWAEQCVERAFVKPWRLGMGRAVPRRRSVRGRR